MTTNTAEKTSTNIAGKYDVGGVLMDRPFRTGRLGHFGLFAEDVAASTEFYCDALGFRVTDRKALGPPESPFELTFLTYGADHHAMVLVPSALAAGDPYYGQGVTLNQISFQVGTLDEVVNAHQLMQARDKDIFRCGRDMPGSNWAVYFRDPDGHIVELYYGMEQIGWDGLSKPDTLHSQFEWYAEPPLPQPGEQGELAGVVAQGVSLGGGNRALETSKEEHVVGGVTLGRPFKIVRTGAISLFVEDIDASIAFYTDDMGMRLTEETTYQGHRCAFLRTASDHHNIALISAELKNVLGTPDPSTLMAYGLQVGSYRQLKDAVAWLRARGYEFLDVPPELYPGIDYAAHLIGPDNRVIQLHYYMEQIGWDGKPRSASDRPTVLEPWPEVVPAHSDVYDNRTFQGPIG